jgi:formate hydrogenlyase subunit 4
MIEKVFLVLFSNSWLTAFPVTKGQPSCFAGLVVLLKKYSLFCWISCIFQIFTPFLWFAS